MMRPARSACGPYIWSPTGKRPCGHVRIVRKLTNLHGVIPDMRFPDLIMCCAAAVSFTHLFPCPPLSHPFSRRGPVVSHQLCSFMPGRRVSRYCRAWILDSFLCSRFFIRVLRALRTPCLSLLAHVCTERSDAVQASEHACPKGDRLRLEGCKIARRASYGHICTCYILLRISTFEYISVHVGTYDYISAVHIMTSGPGHRKGTQIRT